MLRTSARSFFQYKNACNLSQKLGIRSISAVNSSPAGQGEASGSEKTRSRAVYYVIGFTGVSLGLATYLKTKKRALAQSEKSVKALEGPGQRRDDLPNFRRVEILKHKRKEDGGIWVTYNEGVYDITEFLVGHPGGNKILLAAGGQLEPFWELYGVHKKSEVFEILEELRIGNVHPSDMKEAMSVGVNDPYANDPKRHPALVVNSDKPFNAEVPSQLLVDNFITPNELFFVRNHLPVPKVDPKSFQLEVNGGKTLSFSLDDLKSKFKQHTIVSVVQCAGNRRNDMNKVKSVKGLSWGAAAISNAEWTGVLLSDILKEAGISEGDYEHIIFQGLDKDIENIPYEASVPIETAMDPRKEVLVAFEMNGKPLPLDHGFPLRVIVPGVVGARQVKWLSKITASKEESYSHWQRNDYKSFHPSIDWNNVDFSKAVAIQEYPIQSAVCEPAEGDVVEGDELTVRGYAWSGGGRGIVRVDITTDGGATWQEAELQGTPQPRHRQWAWTLWEANIAIPENHKGPLTISCKATDTSHNTQPESVKSVWNLRGLINNAWHNVTVNVENE